MGTRGGCEGVVIEDLSFHNASSCNLLPMFSSNMIFRRLHISEGDGHGHNTDGLDPWGSRNIQFLDSYYHAGDDCVAVKSGKQFVGVPSLESCPYASSDIYIDNITCAKSHGLTVGSEVSSGIANVSFNNIRLHNSGPAVRIKSCCGRGAYVTNISYTNITASNLTDSAVWIDQRYGPNSPATCNETGTTIFRNIRVTNLRAEGVKAAYTIIGLSPDAESKPGSAPPIRGIELDNVSITNFTSVGSCTNADVTAVDVSPKLPTCTHTTCNKTVPPRALLQHTLGQVYRPPRVGSSRGPVDLEQLQHQLSVTNSNSYNFLLAYPDDYLSLVRFLVNTTGWRVNGRLFRV
eukprot:g2672.t1